MAERVEEWLDDILTQISEIQTFTATMTFE